MKALIRFCWNFLRGLAKRCWPALLPLVLPAAPHAADAYTVTLHLQVPAIVDNMQSMGRRELKWQRIRGELRLLYTDASREPAVLFSEFRNLRNPDITYRVTALDFRIHAIGDNATGLFPRVGVFADLLLDPSYNIGDDGEDNTLDVRLAGYGRATRVFGNAAGLMGCGCAAYGHVSPTRIVFWPWISARYPGFGRKHRYDAVTDTAPVAGRFLLRFSSRISGDGPVSDEWLLGHES